MKHKITSKFKPRTYKKNVLVLDHENRPAVKYLQKQKLSNYKNETDIQTNSQQTIY